jgi:hypothetical protein
MSATATRPRTLSVRAIVIAYGAPTIALIAYVLLSLLYVQQPPAYQVLMHALGVLSNEYAFTDLDSVLTAIDCARQGVDVTLPNVCMGGGLFQYSPLLLKTAALPIGPGLRVPVGLGLGALFLLSLFALPRPRRWREFWLLLLATLSSSTLLAIERANLDIALYLLVLLAAHLLLRGPAMRAVGYATILFAAAIKFYPGCLLVLAARERPAWFVPIALAAIAAATLFAGAFAAQLTHILPRLPPVCWTFAR